MTAASAHLTLRPERCNQCGRCIESCPNDAVRIGEEYILVDWHACSQCCGCVEVCAPKAITREVVPLRSSAKTSVTPTDVSKVVVGSRAEAKAVRKAAEQAAKQAGTPVARIGPPAPVAEMPKQRAATVPRPTRSTAERAAPKMRTDDTPLLLGTVEWGVVDVIAVLATLLLTIVGKNAILAIPALGLMPAAGRAAARAITLALYYGVQLGVLVFLAGRHGSALLPAFGLQRDPEAKTKPAERPSALGSAGLVVVLLFGVEFVAIGYGLAVQALGWKQPITFSSDVSSVFGTGGIGLALSVLLVAVVAPVIEELAFRGVVLQALGDRWGMWPGIVISATLFAAYHLNAWLFVPMLVFGVALGWLTWKRRALWPAIALHVAYNGLAVTAAFLVPR